MIDRSTDIKGALRSRQRGFLLNPFRFGGGGGGGGGTDPYWSNVVLLLHCDGTNGSTSFVDSSGSAHSVTAYGGATISTADPLYGSASAHIPRGGYLQIPDSDNFAFGSGDATVEITARFDSNPTVSAGDYGITLIGHTIATVGGSAWMIHVGGADLSNCNVYAAAYSGGTEFRALASGVNLALHTKHTFAMSRIGGTMRMLLNGTVVATNSSLGSASLNNTSAPLLIGRFNDVGYTYYMNGSVDEVRITKGVGRYSSNYTPPTEAFPNS